MADLFTIHPGSGVGDLRFGMTRDEVRNAAGDPAEVVKSEEDPDSEMWVYESAAIALSFAAEEDMRFVSCETFSAKANWNGESFIGLDRDAAEAALERAGADDGMFEEDEEEEGDGQLMVPRLDLSLWFVGGAVESIGWGVLIDEEDEVAWPPA